ncbi:MAG TPA: hypothetical protein VMV23_13465 [Candidatus Nanopelagicaceae bacterium]|nr:hypothetical protein [Candidatus Nanopelagicaceae bacterium]
MAYSLYLITIRPKAGGDPIKAAKAAIAASSRLMGRNLEAEGRDKWQLARSILQAFPRLATLDKAILSDNLGPSEYELIGKRIISLFNAASESGTVLSIGNKIIVLEFFASTAWDPRRGVSEEIREYIEFFRQAKGYQVYDPQSETIW